MNHMNQRSRGSAMMKRNKGFSLLDVLLAMVIFVVGMLALAHLQTNLTRSSTDANTRTVAASIAEEILEELRGFRRISTDPDGTLFAFADIDSAYIADTVTRGGNDYVVTADVGGFDFNSDRTAVTETDPVAVAGVIYDFKMVELTVTWNNNQEFLIDEGTTISNTDMNSGHIVLKDLIHSISALADAVVAAEVEALGGPIVEYTPGMNPDIVAIQLSDAKFKESTTPKPDVIRRDEFVETWFDVITYNQVNVDGTDAFFLRREEFLVVSCECNLRSEDSDEPAFKPTTWNGAEYVEGASVPKPYGVSASNSQSLYCDTCCRDHHDGGPGTTPDGELYDPHKTWTSGSSTADHTHYDRNNQGVLNTSPVSAGSNYAEACRMVRKDGFMRVAQDFRQEQFIGLPQSYLTDTAGVGEYSDYITAAIDNFISDLLGGNNVPNLDGPGDAAPPVPFPADADNPMDLPVLSPASDSVQFVTRGIYIDHVTSEALDLLDCLAPLGLGGQGNTPETCRAEGVTNYLEIFPFFEIQTTWLSLWEDDVRGNPVSVTSEALADNNTHSRGLASITSLTPSDVTITSGMHRGNIGIAGVDPIDPFHYSTAATAEANLYIEANGGGSPPVVTGTQFSGTIGSSVNGVQASGTTFTGGDGVTCSLNLTQFSCIIPDLAVNPTLTISGYWKNAVTNLWVCESTGLLPVVGAAVQTDPKSMTFDLRGVAANRTNVIFTIKNSATCP